MRPPVAGDAPPGVPAWSRRSKAIARSYAKPRRGRAGAAAPEALEPARELEITIERLAAGGDGVGHAADGRVVFVPFTAPGDRVRVRVTEQRPRFARGHVLELLAPGPARTDPVCAVFGSCGGCTWQHVAYPAQLEAKRAIVEDALSRIAGLGPTASAKRAEGERRPLPNEASAARAVEILASPTAYAWRSRTRVFCENGRIGYRRRHSHALQPVARCPVLVPSLDAALHALAEAPPGDGEIELAVGDGAPRCTPLSSAAEDPERIELSAGEDRLELSPGVFFQAHAGLRDALRTAALDAAGTGRFAADLFAGAGFFTLGLARRFERVLAVEAAPAAADDLRRNAAAAGCQGVEVLGIAVEAALPRLRDAEVLLLDPPRTGLPRGVAVALAAGAAERVVYVSCEPATLARDLAVLAAGGFSLTRAQAFDLFPQTSHVEVLVRLERPRGPTDLGHVDSSPPPARGRA
jgi:23S rRNA (uracil1939-C5)-methyltransferase